MAGPSVAAKTPSADDATYRIEDDGGPPDRRWLLVIGEDGATAHALPSRGEVVLGRGTGCDVVIADGSISRRHATLEIGDTLRIRDLESANGTRVRQARLANGASADLAVGEVFQLGSVMLAVQQGSAFLASAPKTSRALPSMRAGAKTNWMPDGVVVNDPAMRALFAMIERVAQSTINVLVLGETGAGKEVVAEAIHRASPRASKPFVRLNCAAFSPTLLESELFGHERGAFTGAVQTKRGLFETADGGTVLLDEIGELPLELQPKLLRVLEERKTMRVGAVTARAIDVRFVSATHRDLKAAIARGTFRQDLYFRLNGITLAVPPLRERPSEIFPIAEALARQHGGAAVRFTAAARRAIESYAWPGNVRELRNVIERAVLLADGGTIDAPHLGAEIASEPVARAGTDARGDTSGGPRALRGELEAMERTRILEALEKCSGNQTRAAKMLGMPRRTLISRIEAYGIPRPRKGQSDDDEE